MTNINVTAYNLHLQIVVKNLNTCFVIEMPLFPLYYSHSLIIVSRLPQLLNLASESLLYVHFVILACEYKELVVCGYIWALPTLLL